VIFLVRHAKAGDRTQWAGEDWLRPLSRAGQLQSISLIEALATAEFEHIVSSPYTRCLASVVPLAGARGLAIEPAAALAEGADIDDAVALVRKHAEHGAVLCSHGDIIPMLLSHYQERGVDLGPDPRCPKGSTWVLSTVGTEVVAASYLPPPAD
jgi:8-oxo-dGTP diphosphatase